MCQGKCDSECETIDSEINNADDCSNSNNARCRKPKKLNRIPIIPATDNQNTIDFIPPISEVENLFFPPIPSSIEVGKFVDLKPSIINENIKNSFDNPLEAPEISNIGVIDAVSKHQNFVKNVSDSINPENNSRLPKVPFQISSVSENQPSIPASPIEDFKFQNQVRNISQALDVPFHPVSNPVFPTISNGEFSLDIIKNPTDIPIQNVPISLVPLVENASRINVKPTLDNIQTHFEEHGLVPSPLSQVEIFQDVMNELGSTTAVPKPLKLKSEEDRKRPKANTEDVVKLTTVDILKDFSPSPKFPYPNTEGRYVLLFLASCKTLLFTCSSLQQEQQLQLYTNYTETLNKIKQFKKT